MNRLIVLDAGPLGLLSSPPGKKGQASACASWLRSVLNTDAQVIVPEIADYEVRRELLRLRKAKSLQRLDALCSALEYLPLTTTAMRKAAELWAEARRHGMPTASDKSIDGDIILAAQCLTMGTVPFIVATTNVGHLSRFVAAERWQEIKT